MSRPGGILNISYTEFNARVPRLDQQARIALKCVRLLYENGVDNVFDLILTPDKPATETRLGYVSRRAAERTASLETDIESYVLDRGFGTETARAIIKHRQEHPTPIDPEEYSWTP